MWTMVLSLLLVIKREAMWMDRKHRARSEETRDLIPFCPCPDGGLDLL